MTSFQVDEPAKPIKENVKQQKYLMMKPTTKREAILCFIFGATNGAPK